jgi:hypothetical protein
LPKSGNREDFYIEKFGPLSPEVEKRKGENLKKSLPSVFVFAAFILLLGWISEAANASEPEDTTEKGILPLEWIFSGAAGEASDDVGRQSDFPSWRALLKGAYRLTDWLDGVGRLGPSRFKFQGISSGSNVENAAGGGIKFTLLEPSAYPLRYSPGGQFLHLSAEDRDSAGKRIEYDLWLGFFYREERKVVPPGWGGNSGSDGEIKNFRPRTGWEAFKSPTPAGIFFGLGYPVAPNFHLGIDASLLGENSGTFTLRYRF